MHTTSLLVTVGVAFGAASEAGATTETVVASDVYENLVADRDGKNVPVTFRRVGAVGHFTRCVTPVVDGVKSPVQVDVLRKAPDGSVRHALVSFVLPALPAGGKVHIDWLNEDNAWSQATGGPPEPDAQGYWRLRENGWGHGFAWDASRQQQTRQYGWHRYGAWVALVTALEADVPKARAAWQVMLPLAGTRGNTTRKWCRAAGADQRSDMTTSPLRRAADENLPVGQASSLPLPVDSQAGSLRHGTKPTAARLTRRGFLRTTATTGLVLLWLSRR